MDTIPDTDRLLLLTNTIDKFPTGGRELLIKLNSDLLKDIFGDRLVLREISRKSLKGLTSICKAFSGHIDGLNETNINATLGIIDKENISKLFVDGSGFGGFIKIAKNRYPEIEITTFFHNVEARFFLGSLRSAKTVRALAVLFANYLAERKAVKYSDNIVCLSHRDSNVLKKLYGRSATHISAIAMHDVVDNSQTGDHSIQPEKYALFVGGAFYANRVGIEWFVKNIAPAISIKTVIVGRGWEGLKTELERNENVVLVGAAANLATWYRNAHFVIAPIFDGSGMKTKVAEALMFGKKIVGTREAFSGYHDVAQQAGWECATANEFIAAVNAAQNTINISFDPRLRAIFEERYSYAAARSRFADILGVNSNQGFSEEGFLTR